MKYNCPNCSKPLEGYSIAEYESGFKRYAGYCNNCTLTACEFVIKELENRK